MITAQEVNKLRQQTGAGMMDCKRALTEAGGDFGTAIDLLRKRGQKVSQARADKATAEGAVFTKANDAHNYGVMFALSCETDFVAKNRAFQQLGHTILEAAFTHKPVATDDLLHLVTPERMTIQEKITELVGKIGEKITISTYTSLNSDTVVPYLHMGSKLGVLVGLIGSCGKQVLEVGKDIAMQIAAMNPLAIDKDGIDENVVQKELAIAKEQALNEGKPEAIIDKIITSRLNKFFKDNTLLNQLFVKDNKRTIAQYLAGVGPSLKVAGFRRVAIGK
mmetsp:Transcript_4512/g.10206  ORF Transcript_4512/g.10206 Transcript_4512/m.10206 type:complete len:278 (-) Transcript_4512:3220-4053(-)